MLETPHTLKYSNEQNEYYDVYSPLYYLQLPPFKMSHMYQKEIALFFPMILRSISKCPQKYITSPLEFSCILCSRTFSAFLDNATCFDKNVYQSTNNFKRTFAFTGELHTYTHTHIYI